MKPSTAILLTLIASAACAPACALAADGFETNDSIKSVVETINSAGGSVYVSQARELDAITNHSGAEATGSHSNRNAGYRVQVFSDNNIRTAKANAEHRKRAIEQQMPEMRAYLTFESPYWRVRVGDFSSYADADEAMRRIKAAFPAFASDVRIVRERINVVQ